MMRVAEQLITQKMARNRVREGAIYGLPQTDIEEEVLEIARRLADDLPAGLKVAGWTWYGGTLIAVMFFETPRKPIEDWVQVPISFKQSPHGVFYIKFGSDSGTVRSREVDIKGKTPEARCAFIVKNLQKSFKDALDARTRGR